MQRRPPGNGGLSVMVCTLRRWLNICAAMRWVDFGSDERMLGLLMRLR
jgi:hypothetical protein